MPAIVGEYVDRLVTLEMRPGSGNLPRGITHRLYEAARTRTGKPLSYAAASRLTEAVSPGDSVIILTGAGAAPALPRAEVDGILGSVALARALHLCLGARPVIVTEDRATKPVEAAIRAAEFNVSNRWEEDGPHTVWHYKSPIEREECRKHARLLFDEVCPQALVAIEKLSPNRVGVIHGATGLNYDDAHTKADEYVALAAANHTLTCGVGDCGNEIGFGALESEVRAIAPAGAQCQCPCQEGTASAVATDEFLPAAISNWGAYGISAMIALLTGKPNALLTAGMLERMLRATVDAGALDGATARPTLSDDGVPFESQLAVVTLLRQMVEQGLSRLDSPGH
jgi:hypothetical protein